MRPVHRLLPDGDANCPTFFVGVYLPVEAQPVKNAKQVHAPSLVGIPVPAVVVPPLHDVSLAVLIITKRTDETVRRSLVWFPGVTVKRATVVVVYAPLHRDRGSRHALVEGNSDGTSGDGNAVIHGYRLGG